MKNTLIFKENTVEKHFRSKIAFEKEKTVYKIMSGSGLVPRVYSCGDKYIELEKLPGKTIGVLARELPEEEINHILYLCATWFCRFQKYYNQHTGMYLVLEDSNPRNFILYEHRIKGIDFENSHHGTLSEAAGNYLAWYIDVNGFTSEYYKVVIDVFVQMFFDIDIHLATSIAQREYFNKKKRRRLMPLIRRSALVIAAGGKSSRMGKEKGLLPYKNFSICDWLIHNLAVFDNMYISANISRYKDYGIPVITDKYSDIGPLSAIYTAITCSESLWTMVCRCDMPFVNEHVVYSLFENITETAQAVVVTHKDKPYPVLALYHKAALPTVYRQIESGNYKLRLLLDKLNTVYVEYHDENHLKNINTPQDYDNLEK